MNDEPPYPQNPPADQPKTGSGSEALNTRIYHSEIDPELKTKALLQMCEAIKGNGLKNEDVDITAYDGETLEFLAITEMKLDTKLSIKRQAGKITGPTLVANAGAFQEAVNKETYKITHSLDVVERIRDAVLERPDKGLCLKNILIKLPFLHKDFVTHEPCSACASKGKITCVRCHGKGREPCPRCHARGSETCPTCGGRQYILGPNNQNQQCMRCNGTGRIGCSQCHESREVQCAMCKAVGTMQCRQCNGHAWNSVLCRAEINPVGLYSFDRTTIPQQALEKLDLLGSDIQHHSNIQIIHRHKELEQERNDISIPYHIKVPMAHVTFMLKEKLEIPAFLFGTQAKLYDMPPFLEKITAPGIKALKAAAMGQGDAASLIQKAGRYRTLREILLATSKLGPKKTLKVIEEKNPIGLSEDTTRKLVLMACKAIGFLGKKPRQISIALGLLITAGLGAFYWYIGKAALLPYLPHTNNIALLTDGIAGLTALGAGYVTAKTYLKRAMQKSLESLFSK
ncbi:MAG TPA: hypothetical protein PK513_06675 [Alphaproteobacteria bacterium]|nr:MAG: hypothetical protein H6859_08540 [Rhodospirillales bacterium]HOO82168.1 hypothetical protein [Alphaproteobacteria bacterium]